VREHLRRTLSDPEVIRGSRQLPFRWLSAYRVMEPLDGEVAGWLEGALEVSADNLSRLPGTTVIACDNSGSMSWCTLSESSTLAPRDIAGTLGAVARRICDRSLVVVFADRVAEVHIPPGERVLAASRRIASTDVGGSTLAYHVLRHLIFEGIRADRLLVFTDMQIYGDAAWDANVDFTTLVRKYRRVVSRRSGPTSSTCSPTSTS